MGLRQQKVFTSWLVTVLAAQDPIVAWSLPQGELLYTKVTFCTIILQLAGIASQVDCKTGSTIMNSQLEAELQKSKSKLSIFLDFRLTMDFDVLGLYFHFGTWYCLRAELCGLNGVSVMESVVLSSGALLQCLT